MTLSSSPNESQGSNRGSAGGSFAEAILYDRFRLHEDGATIGSLAFREEATRHLIAKGNEAMIKRTDSGAVRWGNSEGIGILERLDQIQAEIRAQGAKIDTQGAAMKEQGATMKAQDSKIATLEADGEVMQAELKDLKAVNNDYLNVRNRFMSNFVQNKLGPDELGPDDKAIIQAGNDSAHHGDVATNALLYKRGIRDDVNHYKIMYGIFPSQLDDHLSSNDDATLEIKKALTRHGTMSADTRDWLPGVSFLNSFTAFVGALEAGSFSVDNVLIEGTAERTTLLAYQAELSAVPASPQVLKKLQKGKGKKK